jgi:hypothetical protein
MQGVKSPQIARLMPPSPSRFAGGVMSAIRPRLAFVGRWLQKIGNYGFTFYFLLLLKGTL